MYPKLVGLMKRLSSSVLVVSSLLLAAPSAAQTTNLLLRIQDVNGNPMRGYLVFRDAPPSHWNGTQLGLSAYYDYFTSFGERTYTVQGSPAPYLANGTINLRNTDIRSSANGTSWQAGKLAYVFFFWSDEASLVDSGTLEQRIARCNRVTWWTSYLGEKEAKLIPAAQQYVTVLNKPRWTESIRIEANSPGTGYFPNLQEHQSFVLEPPIDIRGQVLPGNRNRPPMMLVHGINGNAGYWDDKADHPITVDLRISDFPVWELYYGLGQENLADSGEMMSLAIQEVLRANPAATKVDMVTHSFGGVVARQMLHAKPQSRLQLRRLLMVSPPQHGSYSAYRVRHGDAAVLAQRIGLLSGQFLDPSAPIYRDLSPGSTALLDLVRSPDAFSLFSSGDDPEARVFVLAGDRGDSVAGLAHIEAPGHDDGVVSVSSASLLNLDVPLGTMSPKHTDQPTAPEIVMAAVYLSEGADDLRTQGGFNFSNPCGSTPRGGVVVDTRGYSECPSGISVIRFSYPGRYTPYTRDLRKNEESNSYFLYGDMLNYSWGPSALPLPVATGLAFPFDSVDATSATLTVVCASSGGQFTHNVEVKGCQTNTFRLSELSQPAKHRLTVVKNGSGTVLSTPEGIDCGDTCSAEFTEREVTLTASPAGQFTTWGGACSGTNPVCRVSLSSSATVVANFSASQVNVEYFTADPNPILVAPGQEMGKTKLQWKVNGSGLLLNVRVNSATGTSLTGPNAASTGETETGDWVRDGMEFFLVNEAGTPPVVLAQVTVRVQAAGTPTVDYFRADPNPIIVAAGQEMGKTKLQWKVNGSGLRLNVRVDSTTGTSLTGPNAASTGETETGDWVRDGMVFFLVNEVGDAPVVLAQVLVRVQGGGGGGSFTGPHGIEFVQIHPGEFMMGCSPGDTECFDNESPRHTVRITRGFEMGKYEVTQAQWEVVMGSNPSSFRGADRPVERVSWNDIQAFLQRLNVRNDGYRYRLPTEAEWEYAARAGTAGAWYGDLDAIAWHSGNSGGQNQPAQPVGRKQPNAWGLYDMIGNVWEWVDDWWYREYTSATVTDPRGPTSGTNKMLRGGSWGDFARFLRVSNRVHFSPGVRFVNGGFRCVRE